jgi:pyruvate dehydrogenase (quinone)
VVAKNADSTSTIKQGDNVGGSECRRFVKALEKGINMAKRVAELLVDVLVEAGVQRVYGVSGDSLNGITDSIRTRKEIEWVHVRHEEVAWPM